jgi:hypothetical protein
MKAASECIQAVDKDVKTLCAEVQITQYVRRDSFINLDTTWFSPPNYESRLESRHPLALPDEVKILRDLVEPQGDSVLVGNTQGRLTPTLDGIVDGL